MLRPMLHDHSPICNCRACASLAGAPNGCFGGPFAIPRGLPPVPAPSQPEFFKITFDAVRPLLTDLIAKGFQAQEAKTRRRRNEARVNARFETATAKLIEASTWAIVMADKPGEEWKSLLTDAITMAQIATRDLLSPEVDDVSEARFDYDDHDPNPSCPCCGIPDDRDAMLSDHATSCDKYVPDCTCKTPNAYLAPELHDCELGAFVRAKCQTPKADPPPPPPQNQGQP